MMTSFLPYHCPTFRTDHLVEPCAKNLSRGQALKEAHKHVGPLEKCLECRGKMLITKPRTVIEGLPAPESWVEKEFVAGPPEEAFKPYQQDWDPNPEVTTAPLFLKDVGKMSHAADAIANLVPPKTYLLPEKIREEMQRMAERYRKEPKREKIVPELPKTKVMPVNFGLEVPVEPRYCPTHLEVLQRVDKLGRWMGMCDECLAARGKKCGLKNFEKGVSAAPMSIPLNLPKYAPVKEWLQGQAEENERTLMGQIMFILKTAWRQGP